MWRLRSSIATAKLLSELKEQVSLRLNRDDFYKHAADLATTLTRIRTRVADSVREMLISQQERIRSGINDLNRISEWSEFTQEEQQNAKDRVEEMALVATEDMAGLKQLLSRDYEISTTLRSLQERIKSEGMERKRKRLEVEKLNGITKLQTSLIIPKRITTSDQLDGLIRQLTELKDQALGDQEIEITITLEG